jgi:hypothetical protein
VTVAIPEHWPPVGRGHSQPPGGIAIFRHRGSVVYNLKRGGPSDLSDPPPHGVAQARPGQAMAVGLTRTNPVAPGFVQRRSPSASHGTVSTRSHTPLAAFEA